MTMILDNGCSMLEIRCAIEARHQWIRASASKDVLRLPTDLENQSVSGQYPGSGSFRPGGLMETGTSPKMGQRAPGLTF